VEADLFYPVNFSEAYPQLSPEWFESSEVASNFADLNAAWQKGFAVYLFGICIIERGFQRNHQRNKLKPFVIDGKKLIQRLILRFPPTAASAVMRGFFLK